MPMSDAGEEVKPITVGDVALPGETDRYVSLQRQVAVLWLLTLPLALPLNLLCWLGDKARDWGTTLDLPAYRRRNEMHELNRQWHIRKRRIREAEYDAERATR